jgi:acetyl-CoA C-acetyltransferase
MGSHGIKDRVAIVGMGCTRFAEHWDKSLDDLIVEAAGDTFASAGVTKDDVDAYWLGTAQSGMSGITLARPLQLEGKPVTRVENYCTTGSEALRAAAYAVASGAYDVAMAVGAEKVKDSGYQGLNAFPIPNDGTQRTLTAAAMFSMVAPAYGKKYGVDEDELTEVLARISWKNHQNGARNPRAQFRKEVSTETICASPRVAGGSGCSTAPAWPTGRRPPSWSGPRTPRRYTDKPLYIKALAFSAGSGSGLIDPEYDYTWFPECAGAAEDAYRRPASPTRATSWPWPRCTTASPRPSWSSWRTSGSPNGARRGRRCWPAPSTSTASSRSTPTAGLKSFGHPVGRLGAAHVLRDLAPAARRGHPRAADHTDRTLALTHNLGGYPGEMVSFVSVVGTELGI